MKNRDDLSFEYFDPDDLSWYLDPKSEIKFSRHYLPHWAQLSKIQSITFRLRDSLPQSVLLNLKNFQDEFRKNHPEPWDESTHRKFKALTAQSEERYLNAGYGSCILKYQEVRKILEDALHFKNNDKYLLLAYVIMPNHVHLIMAPAEGEDCLAHLTDIKRYSTRVINRLLMSKGSIFSENWDRLIRNDEHLDRCVYYIYSNPKHLMPGTFSLGGVLIEGKTFAL